MDAIWATMLLLGVAMVLGAVFERFKQSAILGYLLAGALIGPHAFNVLGAQDTRAVEEVSQVGVALLLFTIGLEFSLARLKSFGVTPWVMGSIQVFGTLGLVTLCTLPVFGLDNVGGAVSLGAVIALSSTAVVLRTLGDRSELDSIPGRQALGILLFQDIMVVPLIVLVFALNSPDGGGAAEVMKYLGKELVLTVMLVAGMFVLTHYGMPRLVKLGLLSGANREVPVLFAVVSAGAAAFVAEWIGLSAALGAFVAGVMLGESVLATQIRADVSGIKTVFVTLFFAAVGMLADPFWIAQHWYQVVPAVVGVIVAKTLVVLVAGAALRLKPRHALASGLAVAQIGEFSFVLLAAMQLEPEDDLGKLIVAVTIGSLFVTPYLIAAGEPLGRLFERGLSRRGIRKAAGDTVRGFVESADESSHAVVIGFGPAGRLVAHRLLGVGRAVTVLDLNPSAIGEANQAGFRGHVGDVTSQEVLEHARVPTASVVVVTLPDHRVSAQVVQQVRAMSPNATVIVRSRYARFVPMLEQTGAAIVIDEEQAVGAWLAAEALQRLPVAKESRAS